MATKTKSKSKASVKKAAEGDPEAIMDPERTLGADELRRREELEDQAEVRISTFNPQTHHELVIDFTGLAPDRDFEVRIEGPTAQNYWVTLKSDPWGQAQLIWRTRTGGKYTVSGKGEGINVSGQFEIAAYDPDEEYRLEKRRGRKKLGHGQSLHSVEEPGVMGDKPSREARNEPDTDDPAINDPAFTPAEHDPEDQGDPAINKEPHPEGSPQFNYRVPGEAETFGPESKEDPEGDPKKAKREAKKETKATQKRTETPKGEVSPNAGQSDPKTQLEMDRENAHTGADEADR